MKKIENILMVFINAFKKNFRLFVLLLTCSLLLVSLFYTYMRFDTNKYKDGDTKTIPVAVDVHIVGENQVYSQTFGSVRNKNVVELGSLSNGVLNQLKVEPGDEVKEGEKLAEITQTYSGDEYFEAEIDLIKKEISKWGTIKSNLDKLYALHKDLGDSSIDNLEENDDLKEVELESLDKQIEVTKKVIEDINAILSSSDNVDPVKSAELIKISSDLNQLVFKRNMLEYETSSSYPGTDIAEIENKIQLEEVKLKLETAKLEEEIAKMKLKLVETQKDLRTVKSTIKGTIEKVYINEGESVSSGQTLFKISGESDLIIQAKITRNIVNRIDDRKSAIVNLKGKLINVKIEFVSSVPIDSDLYELLLKPDKKSSSLLESESLVDVRVPLKTKTRNEESEGDTFFIPLDSIFRSNGSTSVLIIEGGTAIESNIITGETVGNQIEVLEGLNKGQLVILDRTIISGQNVEVRNINGEYEEEKEEEDVSENDGDKSEE